MFHQVPIRSMGQAPQGDPMVLNEQFFQQHKGELMEFGGQFALVANQQLVDIFPSYQDAFDGAIQKGFQAGTFLIKEISEGEPVETI